MKTGKSLEATQTGLVLSHRPNARPRGGQVHIKTVSHVCHRLEIPKPIQSLKKAGNL